MQTALDLGEPDGIALRGVEIPRLEQQRPGLLGLVPGYGYLGQVREGLRDPQLAACVPLNGQGLLERFDCCVEVAAR